MVILLEKKFQVEQYECLFCLITQITEVFCFKSLQLCVNPLVTLYCFKGRLAGVAIFAFCKDDGDEYH